MNKDQYIERVKKEIDWCLEHPAENLSKDFQRGFVSGLQQAIYVLKGRKRNENAEL